MMGNKRENVIHDGSGGYDDSMMILIDTPGRIMGVVGFVAMLIGTITLSTEFWQALLASSVFGIFMMLLASKDE